MQRNKIYKTKRWEEVRNEVLKMDHYECQRCNHNLFDSGKPKRITKAYLVHHILYANKYPQYIYSIYVNGKRNLVSLCYDCHEELHGRKFKGAKPKERLNEERFD